jgi:hypothetical protein
MIGRRIILRLLGHPHGLFAASRAAWRAAARLRGLFPLAAACCCSAAPVLGSAAISVTSCATSVSRAMLQ